MVVILAVRLAILLVEVLRIEWDVTLVTLETARMPVLAHRTDVVVLNTYTHINK